MVKQVQPRKTGLNQFRTLLTFKIISSMSQTRQTRQTGSFIPVTVQISRYRKLDKPVKPVSYPRHFSNQQHPKMDTKQYFISTPLILLNKYDKLLQTPSKENDGPECCMKSITLSILANCLLNLGLFPCFENSLLDTCVKGLNYTVYERILYSKSQNRVVVLPQIVSKFFFFFVFFFYLIRANINQLPPLTLLLMYLLNKKKYIHNLRCFRSTDFAAALPSFL